MKPDWKNAPSWALWLAQDKSGDWYWYASRPEPAPRWRVWATSRVWATIGMSISKFAGHSQPVDSWKETLEGWKRP